MKKFGTKSFKACGCGKKSCKICTIPDNATKLLFHTTNKKNKPYTLKPTKKQLEVMKRYWKLLQKKTSAYWSEVCVIEDSMSEQTGINALEFFMCDNEIVGIGNRDRSMKLLQRRELER